MGNRKPKDDPEGADDEQEEHTKVISEIDEFHKNQNIDDYVSLRFKYPMISFEYFTSDGIEFLFSEKDVLTENGIDPSAIGGAFEGDAREQSLLSLILLQKLIDRNKLISKGESQVVSRKMAISNGLVNYLIANMLDAAEHAGQSSLSWDLIVLIKYQLGVIASEYELKNKKEDERRQALFIAIALAAEGETPSYRKISARMGVQASTVKRWFPDDSMISMAKSLFGDIRNVRARHLKAKPRR